ncbi:XPG N-terminal domain-containing protein [Toxoplasma gondii ME49]|uniref:XPG N-terminal domain-containing protein n=5 Tax=Toxoplasma gondii TaxID=5811 RepID=S8ET06_TOXGM|nr:XPG N-terminal domain-containing protein [Toxoplasma gondii ME49]EPT25407.1 XPG N-terminal domain-containing protein [Toxoplasma gondii ME49]|eukprot:XP_018635172.1 XPG N-terminal domain-containing protein [Toxoplasma gondii ME49]
MGVKGLWNWLDSNVKERMHLRDFSGKTIAVDASSWLHKAACGCALALLLVEEKKRLLSDRESREEPEAGACNPLEEECEAYRQILRFCLGKIRLLTSFGVRPFLVFDGGQLEAKAPANESRRLTRRRHAALALAAHRAGDVANAWRHAVGAISVSLSLRNFVFRNLQGHQGVVCISAAYEADAQMARLVADGFADAVLTEDGDLLAYQARMVLSRLSDDGTVQCVDCARCFHLERPRGERRQRAKAESTSPTREPDAPCSSVAFRCPSSLSDSSSASACVSSLRPSSASRTTSPTSSHASPYSSSSSRSSSSLSSHFSSLSSSPSRASPLPSPDSASFSSVSSPPLASASPRPSSASLGLSLDRFQLICVLAGCDYAPNIPGVGVRTAARLVRRHGADVHAILQDLRASGKSIPHNYAHQIRLALLTYRHQTVFVISPTWEIRMAPLTDLPAASLSPDILRCLGVVYDDETARSLCLGFRHPATLEILHPRMHPKVPPPLCWLNCKDASAKPQSAAQRNFSKENDASLSDENSTPSGAALKHSALSPEGKLSAKRLSLFRRCPSSASEAEDASSGAGRKHTKKCRSETLNNSQTETLCTDADNIERKSQTERNGASPVRCSLETPRQPPHTGVYVHHLADAPQLLPAESNTNTAVCEDSNEKDGRVAQSVAEAIGQMDELEGRGTIERKPRFPAEPVAARSPVVKLEQTPRNSTSCSAAVRPTVTSVSAKRKTTFFGLLGIRRGLPGVQRKDK